MRKIYFSQIITKNYTIIIHLQYMKNVLSAYHLHFHKNLTLIVYHLFLTLIYAKYQMVPMVTVSIVTIILLSRTVQNVCYVVISEYLPTCMFLTVVLFIIFR